MKLLPACAVLFMLGGCSLPYRAQTDHVPDGYSHERLDDGSLRVTYRTWRWSEPDALCELAARRAGELLEGGEWVEKERTTDLYAEYVEVPAFTAQAPVGVGASGVHTRSETFTQAYTSEIRIKRCVLLVEPVVADAG